MGFKKGDRRKVKVGNKTVEIDEVNRVIAEFMPYIGDREVILDTMEAVYSWGGDKVGLKNLSNRLKSIRAGLRDLGYHNVPFKRYTELTDIRKGGKEYE